jgi:hypothetical protein
MILLDVNVLVYAMREDAERHAEYAVYLRRVLGGAESVGVSDMVLSGAVRILTHRRIFRPPTPMGLAMDFAEFVRESPNVLSVSPGARHWEIFTDLCRATNAVGGLVTDAWFAALAIEQGCEWVSADRDFARFPGLRWHHPLGL